MDTRVSFATRVRVAALLVAALTAFAVLVGAFGAWVRWATAPEISGENAVSIDPLMNWANVPRVSESEAAKIAVAEVKKREGWSGKFTHADREGFRWYLIVRHEPNVPHDYRVVEINGSDGKVLDVSVLKTDQP
jgi:hypothetical protein